MRVFDFLFTCSEVLLLTLALLALLQVAHLIWLGLVFPHTMPGPDSEVSSEQTYYVVAGSRERALRLFVPFTVFAGFGGAMHWLHRSYKLRVSQGGQF